MIAVAERPVLNGLISFSAAAAAAATAPRLRAPFLGASIAVSLHFMDRLL